MSRNDTIVAVASAPGRGAVGVLRVSGPRVAAVARAVLGGVPTPRRALLRGFLDAAGASLDQGIALYFPAPHSYTGEEMLELQGHGGPVVLDLLMRRMLELGCRAARPGEFTERAFLNGKMDMAQAEAVAALIDAESAGAARAAMRSLKGEFSSHIAALVAQITALRAYVEAAIDFPDEEADFLADANLTARLDQIFAAFDSLATAARQGAMLREGLHVVIAGPANAGKSSLLNRLAGADVAIVTEVPGTTRDVLRQRVLLEGVPLNLADTAGLRATEDRIEAEGVRRAGAELSAADHVLLVIDASLGLHSWEALRETLPRSPADALPDAHAITMVFNKIDLLSITPRLDVSQSPARVFVSARTGAGLELLRQRLKVAMGHAGAEAGAFAARRRHLDALDRAKHLVRQSAVALGEQRALELFAEDLRLAQRALGEITGEVSSEDLLGQIFGQFCIGK